MGEFMTNENSKIPLKMVLTNIDEYEELFFTNLNTIPPKKGFTMHRWSGQLKIT